METHYSKFILHNTGSTNFQLPNTGVVLEVGILYKCTYIDVSISPILSLVHIFFIYPAFFAPADFIRDDHRRRMEREAKAKVVASVWGQILFNSLPR